MKKLNLASTILTVAAGVAAAIGAPTALRRGYGSPKNHSSVAQRRSPYYQPTGYDRMKLEQAEAKRQRRAARNVGRV